MTTPTTPIEPVQPVAPTVRPRRGGWINGVLVLAVVIAVGGVAFAVGRSTAATSAGGGRGFQLQGGGSFDPGASFAPGRGGPGGIVAGSPTLRGTVESIDADSMVLKLDSGATVEISRDDQTAYHEQTDATADDVPTGSEVLVELDLLTGRPAASDSPDGPLGNATDITVVP